MRYKQVVVIGSSDENNYTDTAYRIGLHIAKKGWVLISGGRGGIMEAASRGASDGNGIAIGILPGTGRDEANKYCNIIIPTGIGYARNLTNVLSGDVIVSIGGKSGTLSELAYAWQFGKPVILCKFSGGWSEKISESPIDDRKGSKMFFANTLQEVFGYLDKLLD
jgi:uncharacterized protein (TIGR00725 family)